jgi:hypothetical protein
MISTALHYSTLGNRSMTTNGTAGLYVFDGIPTLLDQSSEGALNGSTFSGYDDLNTRLESLHTTAGTTPRDMVDGTASLPQATQSTTKETLFSSIDIDQLNFHFESLHTSENSARDVLDGIPSLAQPPPALPLFTTEGIDQLLYQFEFLNTTDTLPQAILKTLNQTSSTSSSENDPYDLLQMPNTIDTRYGCIDSLGVLDAFAALDMNCSAVRLRKRDLTTVHDGMRFTNMTIDHMAIMSSYQEEKAKNCGPKTCVPKNKKVPRKVTPKREQVRRGRPIKVERDRLKRPMNSFIHFRKSLWNEHSYVKSEEKTDSKKKFAEIAVDAGKRWKSLDPIQKNRFVFDAVMESCRFIDKYPTYKYQPRVGKKKKM